MDLRRWLRIPFARPAELRALGILGMNQRNADFVLPGNPRLRYPLVDDKRQTKRICESHDIPVPRTYFILERLRQIRGFARAVAAHREFVLKPAQGAEGRGILVVADHDGLVCTTSSGQRIGFEDLRYHIENTLAGLYSLAGQADCVIVEQRIVRHAVFACVAVGGTPDIRVIVFRGVPVMAMVRLPTAASRGRANLHQGAIAAGVNLRTGRTFGGVCANRAVANHPDTDARVAGIDMPCWDNLLRAAMTLADALGMDYIGIDFVLDAVLGPVVLEANARPGLAIQIANRRGLVPCLQHVERAGDRALDHAARLEIVATLPGILSKES
jgi:alpha-L-glutamate ligase-like protein